MPWEDIVFGWEWTDARKARFCIWLNELPLRRHRRRNRLPSILSKREQRQGRFNVLYWQSLSAYTLCRCRNVQYLMDISIMGLNPKLDREVWNCMLILCLFEHEFQIISYFCTKGLRASFQVDGNLEECNLFPPNAVPEWNIILGILYLSFVYELWARTGTY